MKKKLVINALAAILTLSLLVGASYALFTATSSVSGNTLVNGTLTFSLVDPATNNVPLAFGLDPAKGTKIYAGRTPNDAYRYQKDMLPNNELNLAAGDSVNRVFVLANTGSLDQYFRFYLTNVKLTLADETVITDLDNAYFANYAVSVFATNTHCGGFNNPGHQIARVTNFKAVTGADKAVAGILFAKNGNVATGSSSAYKLQIALNANSPQELQGATLTFDIQYDAVQIANNYDPNNIPYQGFGGSLIDMHPGSQALINWN